MTATKITSKTTTKAATNADLVNTLPSLADNAVQECPWPLYQQMHTQKGGFYFDDTLNMYICADYKLMREILRNTTLYSSENSQNPGQMRKPPDEVIAIQEKSVRPVNILVSADPPEHARVRKLLDDPFRPRQIEELRLKIRAIVNDCIDKFIDNGHCEVVADFAIPIPVTVIADMLGLEHKYAMDIKAWSDASVEPLGLMLSDERWIECAKLMQQFQEFITTQLEYRKEHPQKDLLTHLVTVRDAQGQPLTLGEMLAVTQQILVAGNETTTNAIAAGVQLLIDNPDKQAQLRRAPERMLTFVNEVLRLESPVQGLFRVVTENTTINAIDVPAGSRIMLRYAAANRDGKKYQAPDSLDIHRANAGTQLGFGAGIHHCLGANLARVEMAEAFSALLARLDHLKYSQAQNNFHHHPSVILRGLEKLHIEFEPAGD